MCAGFGRVGQIVGRILVGWRIPFTALDIHPEHVETVRRFGNKVYFGDASRLDLLIAAKTDCARSFVRSATSEPPCARRKRCSVISRTSNFLPAHANASTCIG